MRALEKRGGEQEDLLSAPWVAGQVPWDRRHPWGALVLSSSHPCGDVGGSVTGPGFEG